MPKTHLVIRRFFGYMFLMGAVHTITSQPMGALTGITVMLQCALAALLTERES